ncbi:serine/threonine transporter SstT, partial [Campylobacter vulpis]|nr:serine/threonine transporter SstT [Campylobacter vulpis]
MFAKLIQGYSKGNLILQICIGIVLGIFVGLLSKDMAVVANF